jgi:hypothetical protein
MFFRRAGDAADNCPAGDACQFMVPEVFGQRDIFGATLLNDNLLDPRNHAVIEKSSAIIAEAVCRQTTGNQQWS